MNDLVETKCYRCESTDISISNVDGYVCQDCNCWFDVEEESGEIIFAYDHFPGQAIKQSEE